MKSKLRSTIGRDRTHLSSSYGNASFGQYYDSMKKNASAPSLVQVPLSAKYWEVKIQQTLKENFAKTMGTMGHDSGELRQTLSHWNYGG